VNVAICAYGAGNVRSVQLAFERLGADVRVADDPDEVLRADLAVLPGVGSAGAAMRGLRARGLDAALQARTRPTLGICLGLQLALDESEEDGGVTGLGLLPGCAVRLRGGRVPRIGWAPLDRTRPDDSAEAYWYAHSYAAETPAVTATSEGLTAIAEHGSFVGVQFHPEKSGPAGARFLKRCLSRV
jgi:imidazole glycerol-phosphate synthase subunit HisH